MRPHLKNINNPELVIKHLMKSISCPLYKKPFKSDYFILEFFIGLLGILQGGQSFRLLFGHLFHDLHGVLRCLSSLNTRKHCEAWGHARQPREVNAQAALHRGHTGTGQPEVSTRWPRHERLCSLPRPFLSKPITMGNVHSSRPLWTWAFRATLTVTLAILA